MWLHVWLYRVCLLLLSLVIALPLDANAKHSPEITLACSDWPYMFIKNNDVSGVSYEIAQAIAERTNITFSYEQFPWARLYYYGKTRDNFVIGCLERVYWRENEFYWIGLVNPGANVYFYRLATSPVQISVLHDLRNYRIGVQRNSYYEQFLRDNSFTDENIVPVTSQYQSLLMLKAGRIDFVLMADTIVAGLVSQFNFPAHQLEKAMIAYHLDTYLALSKKSSPELYQQLRDTYLALQKEGKIEQIMQRYYSFPLD